jgi:hypothetical protein
MVSVGSNDDADLAPMCFAEPTGRAFPALKRPLGEERNRRKSSDEERARRQVACARSARHDGDRSSESARSVISGATGAGAFGD